MFQKKTFVYLDMPKNAAITEKLTRGSVFYIANLD